MPSNLHAVDARDDDDRARTAARRAVEGLRHAGLHRGGVVGRALDLPLFAELDRVHRPPAGARRDPFHVALAQRRAEAFDLRDVRQPEIVWHLVSPEDWDDGIKRSASARGRGWPL